jgi:hypothetical protein
MIFIDSYKFGYKFAVDEYLTFSLRKISSSYNGYCIKVRRSSDNTLLDIGFNGEDLDTSSLLSFVGGGNGFVHTWYDPQNGYHATQSYPAYQPQIVNGGVLNTKGGKAACLWTLSNSMVVTVPAQDMTGIDYSFSVVADLTTEIPYQGLITNRVLIEPNWVTFGHTLIENNIEVEARNNSSSTNFNTGFLAVGQGNQVYSVVKKSSGCTVYRNGAVAGSRSGNIGGGITRFWKIGEWLLPYQSWLGTIQEIRIFYSALSTTDRQSIERDQGAYYGITVI